MNLSIRPQMMKNVLYTKKPASGPLRGTAGRVFFECYVTNPPRGCPVGGGGIHRTRWIGNNPRIISELSDFLRKSTCVTDLCKHDGYLWVFHRNSSNDMKIKKHW